MLPLRLLEGQMEGKQKQKKILLRKQKMLWVKGQTKKGERERDASKVLGKPNYVGNLFSSATSAD